MDLWWGKLGFEGMPSFVDQEDGMIWVWDPESKTYTKKPKADQPDRGHQTGGDNNLFDPFVHTEISGVPELEGHMAGYMDEPGDTSFPTDWETGQKPVRDYDLEELEMLPTEEQEAVQRLVYETQEGLSHEASSYWDLTPRQLAQEYGLIPWDKEGKIAQEFVPEGQVKCPNCFETTDLPQCPKCGKGLAPEWNKENPEVDWNSLPSNPSSEFTSWPDREPKRNRMKTDDSYPSMISKKAGWGDQPGLPEEQESVPIDWTPPTPAKSFQEMQAVMQQYGYNKTEVCPECGGTGTKYQYGGGKCPECQGRGVARGTRPDQTRRKIQNNTYLEKLNDGGLGLLLHDTYVVKWYPDRIILDTGGWSSRTTRDRINSWIPGRIITDKKEVFYIPPNMDPYAGGQYAWGDKSRWIPYQDGMTIDYQGNVLNDGYGFSPHYYSYHLAQKLATRKLSEEDWSEWFDNGPAKTEVGKWLVDTSGRLHVSQGLQSYHEDIARQAGIQWPKDVAAVGSVYNDNMADTQIIFPGNPFDKATIESQLQQVFGPVTLSDPISSSGADEKGSVFEPVIITGGQWVISPRDAQRPITGQAWVKERAGATPFNPRYVLVAEHLQPDDYPIYSQGVVAIVTATGGLTSHAAQLATSEGIPVVVGIGQEYNKIETGNYLKIDPTRQDITVMPGLTGESSPVEREQVWNDTIQYQRQRGGNVSRPQFFSHYDEEKAWKEANDPKLDSCPECSAPMAERNGEKFCPDCGHKQPIMTVGADKTAFLPAFLAPLAEGLGAGAAAGGAAEGAAGIGGLMRGAMTPEALGAANGVRGITGPEQESNPVTNPAQNPELQGTLSNQHVAIEIGDPEEEPMYIPEPIVPIVPQIDDPEKEKERREREREREKEREPKKVPAGVRKSDTFGEEEDGWATKNRGENSDPEHDGSGASFKEKGDSPELLKDVNDVGGTKNDDAEEAGEEQHTPEQEKALELFKANEPLVLEFANSDKDGSEHPIIRALDEILEQAFPGYKDFIEEVEEISGEDVDFDNEEGESEEHKEKVEHEASLWYNAFDGNMGAPNEIGPVPGQSGTCPICGQTHMPGTPCPIQDQNQLMQQPSAIGQPMQNITPPQTQRVITKTVESYGEDGPTFSNDGLDPQCPTCRMAGKACDYHRQHPEVDANSRMVQADAGHLHHQHSQPEFDSTSEVLPGRDEEEDDLHSSETHSIGWVDQDGEPLEEGADYELKADDYEIPDKITVDQIDDDDIIYTIHSGDVDYRDQMSKDDLETFGYTFAKPDSDIIDSESGIDMQEDPIRPGHDPIPQEDDLTAPPTFVSRTLASRDWLMDGGGVDVDPELMAKLAGKDFSTKEQKEFIDEQGEARNLSKLDLEGTHYVMDDDMGIGDSLW